MSNQDVAKDKVDDANKKPEGDGTGGQPRKDGVQNPPAPPAPTKPPVVPIAKSTRILNSGSVFLGIIGGIALGVGAVSGLVYNVGFNAAKYPAFVDIGLGRAKVLMVLGATAFAVLALQQLCNDKKEVQDSQLPGFKGLAQISIGVMLTGFVVPQIMHSVLEGACTPAILLAIETSSAAILALVPMALYCAKDYNDAPQDTKTGLEKYATHALMAPCLSVCTVAPILLSQILPLFGITGAAEVIVRFMVTASLLAAVCAIMDVSNYRGTGTGRYVREKVSDTYSRNVWEPDPCGDDGN